MSVTVKVDGLREIEQAMQELKAGTARGVMRRTLKKAAKPLAELIADMAPDDPSTEAEDLHQSIMITSRLSKGARREARRDFLTDDTAAFVAVGPSTTAFHGVFQEFGTAHHAPQPFMRPAWEQDKDALLSRIKAQLAEEVAKSVKRARAKAAKG